MGVKMCVNGEFIEMTQEEIAEMEAQNIAPSRKEQIVNAIREVYSIDDEIAILRQRDTKPEEFKAYFDFVEKIKEEVKEWADSVLFKQRNRAKQRITTEDV